MSKIFCQFYRGMHENQSCEAGVAFVTLPLHGTRQFHDACPCFNKAQSVNCGQSKYPTAEEIAAEERAMEERYANLVIARSAIVAHLGGPWKKGVRGASGTIDCPVCAGVQSLRFSRAGLNGHIHASCMTEDCVRWME